LIDDEFTQYDCTDFLASVSIDQIKEFYNDLFNEEKRRVIVFRTFSPDFEQDADLMEFNK